VKFSVRGYYTYPMKVNITTHILCERPIDEIFLTVLTLNPALLFDKCDMCPQIVNTCNTKKWLRPGTRRQLYSDKGLTFTETLLTVIPGQSFSSKINFNSCQISKYSKSISVTYKFIEKGLNNTQITITYTFETNGYISWLVLNVFYRKRFIKYLNVAKAKLYDVLLNL
jgi:hypothetical protein